MFHLQNEKKVFNNWQSYFHLQEASLDALCNGICFLPLRGINTISFLLVCEIQLVSEVVFNIEFFEKCICMNSLHRATPEKI